IIRGAVEVLEDDAGLNSGQRLRIARIERASHDMADLTSALLHLARAGNLPDAVPEPCSIAEVVRESVEKQRALSDLAQVEIRLELDRDITIPVEKILATIVVDNLIDNAIQHAGTSRVCVRLADQCLTVSDTGKGIAESELDHIFQRHYRGSASNGSGIGLSLVKRICDLRGWRIAIESKAASGTTAVLFFTKN
ncbi:MAG: HAMP domain-containing sensor histidine kinase, partial [Hydrogenophilaceae bacterium]